MLTNRQRKGCKSVQAFTNMLRTRYPQITYNKLPHSNLFVIDKSLDEIDKEQYHQIALNELESIVQARNMIRHDRHIYSKRGTLQPQCYIVTFESLSTEEVYMQYCTSYNVPHTFSGFEHFLATRNIRYKSRVYARGKYSALTGKEKEYENSKDKGKDEYEYENRWYIYDIPLDKYPYRCDIIDEKNNSAIVLIKLT